MSSTAGPPPGPPPPLTKAQIARIRRAPIHRRIKHAVYSALALAVVGAAANLTCLVLGAVWARNIVAVEKWCVATRSLTRRRGGFPSSCGCADPLSLPRAGSSSTMSAPASSRRCGSATRSSLSATSSSWRPSLLLLSLEQPAHIGADLSRAHAAFLISYRSTWAG